jgi:hypothetical protein
MTQFTCKVKLNEWVTTVGAPLQPEKDDIGARLGEH